MPELKVAIVVPVYNTEQYLNCCLNSIMNQTYKHFEVYIVDDGSTDRSGEILKQFSQIDDRFHVYYKINEGPASARNFALNKIEEDGSFDVICYIDSDDVVSKYFLSVMVDKISTNNADCVIVGFCKFDKNKQYREKRIEKEIVLNNAMTYRFCFGLENYGLSKSPAMAMSVFNIGFQASKIRKVRFDKSLNSAEDQDYLLRCFMNIDTTVVTEKILYYYRIRKSSLTHANDFSVKDIDMYLNLAEKIKEVTRPCREVIEYKAFQNFWKAVNVAVLNKKLEELWRGGVLTEKLTYMEKNFQTDVLKSRKARKRIKIFKMGPLVICIYVYVKRLKYLMHNDIDVYQ